MIKFRMHWNIRFIGIGINWMRGEYKAPEYEYSDYWVLTKRYAISIYLPLAVLEISFEREIQRGKYEF